MTFNQKPTAIIWAKDSNGNLISVDGVTNDATTPENAVAQINKILAIVGNSIVANGMNRIKTEEAK